LKPRQIVGAFILPGFEGFSRAGAQSVNSFIILVNEEDTYKDYLQENAL